MTLGMYRAFTGRRSSRPLLASRFMFALQSSLVEGLDFRNFFRLTRACLALLLLSSQASGQLSGQPTIQPIDVTQIVREEPERGPTDFPFWVSQSDCYADDVLTFRIQIQNPSSDNFEVWAGTADCSATTERQGDQANCWRVYRDQVTVSPAAIPIRAQDIVAQNGPATGNNGTPGTDRDCDDRKYINAALYFMYVNDAGQVSSNVVNFSETGIDLRGPIPPRVNAAVAADDSLVLKWENTDPTEFRGYRFYCEAVDESDMASESLQSYTVLDGPLHRQLGSDAGTGTPSGPGAEGLTGDAGMATGGDGGAVTPGEGGGTPAGNEGEPSPSCGGATLTAGEIPGDADRCGSIDSYSANTGYADGLRNGQRYAVAVTAVDRLGNESELSNVVCGTPREVFTFYEDYRTAGGKGGGGICSLSPSSDRERLPLWLAGVAVIGMILRIRRRRMQ